MIFRQENVIKEDPSDKKNNKRERKKEERGKTTFYLIIIWLFYLPPHLSLSLSLSLSLPISLYIKKIYIYIVVGVLAVFWVFHRLLVAATSSEIEWKWEVTFRSHMIELVESRNDNHRLLWFAHVHNSFHQPINKSTPNISWLLIWKKKRKQSGNWWKLMCVFGFDWM